MLKKSARVMKVKAQAEMKAVKSSLNLDLNLSLIHPVQAIEFSPYRIFSAAC